MLNPSTADAELDDPTIRRCISFAKREGCTELTVVNLFAYRSTDPKQLYKVDDPIGPQNDFYIKQAIRAHDMGIVIAAWGAHPIAINRAKEILAMPEFADVLCLGTTKKGAPRHPLYVKSDAQFIEVSSV